MNIVIKLGCQLVLLPFLLIFFAPFFLPYTSFDSKLRPSLPPPRPTPTPSPSPSPSPSPPPPPPPPRPIPSPPRLAYVISGGSGDGAAVLRLLQSLYHPHNYYAVCLDDDADRVNVRLYAAMHPVLSFARNVRVVSASTGSGGPAAISSILHAAAVLLAEFGDWDWLVNIGPGHYPLVTQDDLLCMLWHLPRELNFVDHAMDLRYKNETPMVVDRGLYMEEAGDVLQITEKRSLPTAFDLYTGSAWMILSHTFVEYCIWGWDNLPRRALMYYANSMNSTESYFQTVICNAPQFQNTIVNHSLHFISPDDSQHQHPHHIMGSKGLGAMINSGAPFAANLKKDDPVLDLIDSELLFRGPDMLVPGGWCAGWKGKGTHECLAIDDVSRILPGLGARRVEMLFAILQDVEYRKRRCNQGFASHTS